MTREELDRALELLADAKRELDRCRYRTPEGVALVEYYVGEVTVTRCLAKVGRRSLEDCRRVAKEATDAILLYDVNRYVKPADEEGYRHLLAFYRENQG